MSENTRKRRIKPPKEKIPQYKKKQWHFYNTRAILFALGLKPCGICHDVLRLDNFYAYKNTLKGYVSACKKCKKLKYEFDKGKKIV